MPALRILPVYTAHLSWPLDQSNVRQAQVRAIVTVMATGEAGTRTTSPSSPNSTLTRSRGKLPILVADSPAALPGKVLAGSARMEGNPLRVRSSHT